jgi:hypothetical protein
MPYISTEEVRLKRQTLKAALPQFKFSIRKQDHMKISVTILSGPIEMTKNPKGYEQVNHHWIDEHYNDRPQVKNVLKTIHRIIAHDQKELVYDGDYGSVPTFYIGINIGDWDRPYEFKWN